MPRKPSSRRRVETTAALRERVAIELKTWLRSQGRFRRVRDLEAPTGIPYTSLRDYFAGDAVPAGPRLKRLADLVRTPVLLALAAELSPDEKPTTSADAEEQANTVRRDLDRLASDLEYFKESSKTGRAVLRSILPARDVGYVTSLLKALYDEDQFETWVFFAQYPRESR